MTGVFVVAPDTAAINLHERAEAIALFVSAEQHGRFGIALLEIFNKLPYGHLLTPKVVDLYELSATRHRPL